MLFAVICTDKPDAQDLRIATREAHVKFLTENRDRVIIAGPFLTEDGEGMNGSLVVIEGTSADDVRAFAANDPYAQAGLFASVEIRPWKWTIGNPDA